MVVIIKKKQKKKNNKGVLKHSTLQSIFHINKNYLYHSLYNIRRWLLPLFLSYVRN